VVATTDGGGDGSPDVDLTVVIPMHDAEATIGAQLEAILAQRWPGAWEVVVADNGSRDSGPAIVRALHPRDRRVRLVDASDVPGASHARNVGVANARGAAVAFCDADDLVAPGWLAAMGEGLRRVPAATGPQERGALNPSWSVGAHGDAGDGDRWFAGIFPFGPSANLGIRRALFQQLGGFDERLHVGEDIDLCLRLWESGYELAQLPDAVVHYRHRSTLLDTFRQAIAYGTSGPMIVARLARGGHPTPSRLAGVRSWLWLVRRLPTLRTQHGRARWLVVAGRSIGRIAGSIRHRTLYL
jgi:glycosyltransferase involved in cell wall biosynthesis